MAHQDGLVDGARVVVQAARDGQVRHGAPGGAAVQGGDDVGQLGQPLLEQLVGHPQGADPLDERGVRRADVRQGQRLRSLLGARADLLLEQPRDLLRADLLQLVDAAQHAGGVLQADAPVEALGELAVVHADEEVADRQGAERLGHHQCDVGVVPGREGAVADDVDVRLGELAGAALLRALPAPDLLHLVATEGEGEVAGVLHDVAGERHGEVEVQGQALGVGRVLGIAQARGDLLVLGQARDRVDLLVHLALAQQLAQGLHGTGLDAGEPVQLEGPPQRVEHVLLHEPLGGQPLVETGQGGLAGHGDPSRRRRRGRATVPRRRTGPF